jgi:hypothetical protein
MSVAKMREAVHLVDRHLMTHPSHGNTGVVGLGRSERAQHLHDAPRFELLGKQDFLGEHEESRMRVVDRCEIEVRHLHRLVVVVAHVLQEANVDRAMIRSRSRIASPVADAGSEDESRDGDGNEVHGVLPPGANFDLAVVVATRHVASLAGRGGVDSVTVGV